MTTSLSLKFNNLWVNCKPQKCISSLRLYSTFVPPERKDVTKSVETEQNAVEGREDPDIFSEEFVPPQVMTSWHKNKLYYRLNRMDCLRRRQNIKIPEFYPGSILSVTYSDQYAPDNTMRFVGRCLYKSGFGISAYFNLRNIIEGEAQEIEFLMYDPMIIKYEVIKLEKWKDTDLRYLRDADPSYCTIDVDMTPVAPLPASEELPVFKGKIQMNSPTYQWQWQYHKAWPRPQNMYLAEHFVTEENIANEKFIEKDSWRRYDICRHHDFNDEKQDIMKEMKINKLRIAKVKNEKETE